MPVVVFFALLWAGVLIPVVFNRVQARRAYFASSFSDSLHAPEGAEGFFSPSDEQPVGGAAMAPRAPDRVSPAIERANASAALLRSVLAGILIAVAVSLLAAIVTGDRSMLAVNLALDNCLLAYVSLLVIRRDARAVRGRVATLEIVARPVETEAPQPRRVYSAGVPVIAAPVVGALSGPVASTA